MARLAWCLGAASLMAGCFNPDNTSAAGTDGSEGTDATTGTTTQGTSSATESSGNGSTTEPTTTTADTTADATTDTTTDTTTSAGDQPPTVSLLVNGEMSPADATRGQVVLLEAEVVDDGTIDRVEFYEGGEVIATVDTEPYTAQRLVTSLDNSALSFQARAYDDLDQEGVSDAVGLTVNITGGSTSASDTNIFQTGGIAFNPGGGAAVDDNDNILIVAAVSTTNFAVTGIGSISYTPDLAEVNWQASEPVSLVDGQPQYLPFGKPFSSQDGSRLLIGGNSMGDDGVLDPNASIFRLDASDGATLPFVEVPSDPDVQNIPVAGATRDLDGNVFLHGPDDNIRKYAPNNGALVWESPAGQAWTISDFGMYRMRANLDGDLVTDTMSCDSGSGTCTLSTALINGFDGVEQWREDIVLADDTYFFSLGASVPDPAGGVITVHGPAGSEGGGMVITRRNANGATQGQTTLLSPDLFAVADVTVDAQGQLVVVGTRDTGGSRRAFAARISESDEVLWEMPLNFGTTDDYALSLTQTRTGQLVVVGFSDLEPIFVVFNGDLWAAVLEL